MSAFRVGEQVRINAGRECGSIGTIVSLGGDWNANVSLGGKFMMYRQMDLLPLTANNGD